MRPLDGVVVVSLEQAVAVPYATRLLADLGARVIKVERPGTGDFARHYDSSCGEVSSYFAWTNAGKESVSLDISHPDGREVLDRLVARADVLLCNLSPRVWQRLALELPPALVVGELSGYGWDGPYADRKAFDALVQSEAGLVSLTGEGDVVARAGISVADIAAGVQLQAAVLAALLRRGRTGEGARLRLSLFAAMAEWMHQPMLYAAGTGAAAPRSGAHHPSIAPYGPVACADGAVHLAVQNDGQWQRLCGLIGLAPQERFATVASRVEHREELQKLLEQAFSDLTAAELLTTLDAADVPAALTRPITDLPTHPQLDTWCDVRVPGGTARMLPPPVAGFEWSPGAVPALGEHNQDVLTWLGYSSEELSSLRVRSVL
ncbi:CaiB/BaiF CoA transferase family protein [Lentzea flaviverrucosa]|uniref:Crotonobetainyl-CoA:carnitine CoA-transferase CaiB n=1 Tax=Lentzea flaviverrucosa TaxID=200379 RepID=A0A1H9XQM0_9PSEU|nr:CaiB/BaiF CoA-transferase family protein [Lentzea flaviverrucosa]RDI19733.1 crotonobetainyl-CoA:carnitine CoA-transferase CaiB-like acyl-CoA transferase [Lentzea flaviverrucosa]SES48087.1 Crotonobetainyl-CoA:carnitine CoA-transferase CaiB [Lentzea flaviverrucosa]